MIDLPHKVRKRKSVGDAFAHEIFSDRPRIVRGMHRNISKERSGVPTGSALSDIVFHIRKQLWANFDLIVGRVPQSGARVTGANHWRVLLGCGQNTKRIRIQCRTIGSLATIECRIKKLHLIINHVNVRSKINRTSIATKMIETISHGVPIYGARPVDFIGIHWVVCNNTSVSSSIKLPA